MVGISDSHDEGHKMTNPTDTNPAIDGDLIERLKRNLNDRRLLDGNVGDYNPERVYNIDVGDDDLEQAITALQAQAAQSKRDVAEIERLKYEMAEILGSDDDEFVGAGFAGLSHLREMYKDKWEYLGPSCRLSLKNTVDNYIKNKVKKTRATLSHKEEG